MSAWNDIAVIAPQGDIDINAVPYLRDEVDELVASGMRRIIINCQDVDFIDSTGLAFLLASARRLHAGDGLLSLTEVSAPVTRFLQIGCLLDVLHVSSAERQPVPVLAPDEPPLWTRSLAVRAGVENLGQYRHRVLELLDGAPLSRDDRFDVALATGEALSNAYDHAGGGVGATCTVQMFSDRLVVEVRDRGRGYEIGPDEEPAVSAERGRGIRLMRMLVDHVEVRRRTDGPGTLVRLIKLLPVEA